MKGGLLDLKKPLVYALAGVLLLLAAHRLYDRWQRSQHPGQVRLPDGTLAKAPTKEDLQRAESELKLIEASEKATK